MRKGKHDGQKPQTDRRFTQRPGKRPLYFLKEGLKIVSLSMDKPVKKNKTFNAEELAKKYADMPIKAPAATVKKILKVAIAGKKDNRRK